MNFTKKSLPELTKLAQISTEIVAQKTKAVNARRAFNGETVITLCESDNGKDFVETVKTAKSSDEWVVTNQIDGKDNSYIISAEIFAKVYNANKDGTYSPVGEQRQMFIVNENISFEPPWGGNFNLQAGGVLVPENGMFYGINPKEFAATYSIIAFKVESQ